MVVLALVLAAAPASPAAPAPWPAEAPARVVGAALTDGSAYARLAELTDLVGPRLSGSPGAEKAVRWALQKMKEDGLDARLEPVKVPHWVRGEERGEVLASADHPGFELALTALGGSVGTPQGGVSGEVVEAHTIAEIAALGERARGRIVFLNHTMATRSDYGRFVALRTHGPAEAGKVGAVAVLLRSLATASLRSPHTGVTIYENGPKIPGAAIATEDADALHRLLQRGPVRVRLALGCRTLPDADSFNVVGDIRGTEHPEEIVVMGAHLDSWDLATGAIDDGAGSAIALETGHVLAQLKPRRTVRIVLFMNEENGLAGGRAYAQAHGAELAHHVAALEADSGAGRAQAISVRSESAGLLRPWLAPLEGLGVLQEVSESDESGADISAMGPASVPFASVLQDSGRYFEVHHSAADTLDKVQPRDLAQAAAVYAWTVYALAQMPEALHRPAPLQQRVRSSDIKPAAAPAAR